MRPLDFLGRIKVKLGIVILLAVATAFVVNEYGRHLGLSAGVRITVAGLLSLAMVQLLARGMTKPLREMAAAAQTIAKGRYDLRVRATSRDEVGELARAFNAMAADLGEVDRQRRELVANVSHELRTPIAGLQAVLENVVDGVDPPDPDTLGTALAQTERLGRLVAQLLDLSRLDSGARPIAPEVIEVGALCRQAAGEAALARDDVTVTHDVPPGTLLAADPALLAQVLANLLDNAVRHSPPGSAVRLSARTIDGHDAELTVTDSGPGIPVAERARVFERFSRLDAGRAADGGGAGLGLAIAKEIVEMHGGTLRAGDGADGAGCRMIIHLPGRIAMPDDTPLPAPEPEAGPAGAPATGAPVTATAAHGQESAEGPEHTTGGAGGPAAAAPPLPGTISPAVSAARLIGAVLGLVGGGVVGVVLGVISGVLLGSAFVAVGVLVLVTVGGTLLGASAGGGTLRTVRRRDQPADPSGYVPPPLFPSPALPGTPRWLLPAALVVGIAAAALMPGDRAGLGVVIVAVALGLAVLPAARARLTPWSIALGLTAYALVSFALLRDGMWLVGPMLLAGFGLASLALSGGGGRGWLATIRGGASVLLELPPVPWFLAAPLRRASPRHRIGPAIAGGALAVLLVVVFGVLFASADAVFSQLLSSLTSDIGPGWPLAVLVRVFLFVVFGALVASGVLVALRPVNEPTLPDLRIRAKRPLWLIPLGTLNVLFAVFVAVQITVLFGGDRRVLETAGLTYAEYARSGFFELVTVSVFVLAIVAVACGALRVTGRDRWWLTALLGLLCALTLVILASALHRLDLYIDAYGLSRLRALVFAAIWWLGAVFVLVLVAGGLWLAKRRPTWLPRTLVLLTGLAMVAFAAWNPDLRVAESQQGTNGGRALDHAYLADLGPEAVPALDRLPEPTRSCLLTAVVRFSGLDAPESWITWNLARAQARDVIARHPIVPAPDCVYGRN